MKMALGSVRNHNHDLLQVMTSVRQKVNSTGSLQLKQAFFEDTMRDLRGIGLSAYTSLGKQFSDEFDEREEKSATNGLDITVKSSAFPLLWEMLYSGSSKGNVDQNKFWGFKHRIARIELGTSSSEEELGVGHDFLFGHFDQLSHWSTEKESVKRQVGSLFKFHQISELIAEATSNDLFPDQLIDLITSREVDVLHFACHCIPDPEKEGVLFSEIVVSGGGRAIHFKLHELNAARRDYAFVLNPLVFLNACKTMTNPEHIGQGDSFPSGFLGLGASGVIATACDVPDQFAAAFAEKFYENLLVDFDGCSPTMSEALLQTRQFFAKPPYNNPLGLAYGLYARNDLRIDWKAVAGN
jgi:hypothetical protein